MGGTMVDSIPNQEMPVLGSRLKWTLLSMLSFCTFVCYVFRVNMSIAVITIKDEHHWGAATKGQVLSSFFYGYLLMQFSAKFLTTFIGGKKTLGYGVLIWSTCTLLTTYGPNFGLTGVIIWYV